MINYFNNLKKQNVIILAKVVKIIQTSVQHVKELDSYRVMNVYVLIIILKIFLLKNVKVSKNKIYIILLKLN